MGFRYIVVDDAPFVREIMKNILRSVGGVCVGESSDGENVADLVNKTLPDLMVLDIVLPKKNGIEVARQVREINREVRIIACSTLDDKAIIENAMDIGCDSYIVKPFQKEEIIAIVERFFDSSKERTS